MVQPKRKQYINSRIMMINEGFLPQADASVSVKPIKIIARENAMYIA